MENDNGILIIRNEFNFYDMQNKVNEWIKTNKNEYEYKLNFKDSNTCIIEYAKKEIWTKEKSKRFIKLIG